MRRFRLMATLAAAALVCVACSTTSGPDSRTILVDYSHDEFASFFLRYFPKSVEVRPGQALVFKQTWTGEPHTVTFGTKVNKMLDTILPLLDKYKGIPEEEIPKEAIDSFEGALEGLPFAFSDDGLNQTSAQGCFVQSGDVRSDSKPCAIRKLPAFDGTADYFNSGFIPYEGQNGNTFTMKLADDIKPGTYRYYCAVHGPEQYGEIQVKPANTKIPSQAEVNIEARKEINSEASALLKTYRNTQATGSVAVKGDTYKKPFAGLENPSVEHAAINEFIPRTLKVKVGEKVTWSFFGFQHTVSFNVPAYFPIATVEKDGAVKLNEKLDKPAGGSPPIPESESDDGPLRHPVNIDAGTWDGKGFYSSGALGGGNPPATYTMSFGRPGTYKLACLFHPPMVGTVQVTK